MWHMGYGDMDDGVFENQARSRSRKRPRSFGGGSGGAPSSGLGVWLVTVGLCAVFTATTLPTGVFACTSQGPSRSSVPRLGLGLSRQPPRGIDNGKSNKKHNEDRNFAKGRGKGEGERGELEDGGANNGWQQQRRNYLTSNMLCVSERMQDRNAQARGRENLDNDNNHDSTSDGNDDGSDDSMLLSTIKMTPGSATTNTKTDVLRAALEARGGAGGRRVGKGGGGVGGGGGGGSNRKKRNPLTPTSMVGSLDDDDDDSDIVSEDFDGYDTDDDWSTGDGWSDQEEEEEEEDEWDVDGVGGRRGSRRGGLEEGRKRGRRGGWGLGRVQDGQDISGVSTMREKLNRARQKASTVYREAKSLMSSEMEGVVLKATRPDDLPVKTKHLQTLLRPTQEMPKEFNVYLPVVRKLWAKMADPEWRVSAKALHVLHRFSNDGSSVHATNLKESVSVLRTHHDSRRKVDYFDMETICEVRAPSWSGEDVTPFSEFLRVYAAYVLQRVTQFGPGFAEIVDNYAMMAGDAQMLSEVSSLFSAGRNCLLRADQEGAVPVASVVQVAQDLRDMLDVCAAQLDYLVREGDARRVYPTEVDRWYDFLYQNHEKVEEFVRWANELASRHKLTPLRPVVATPLVLKMRDEELEIEAAEAEAAAAAMRPGSLSLGQPQQYREQEGQERPSADASKPESKQTVTSAPTSAPTSTIRPEVQQRAGMPASTPRRATANNAERDSIATSNPTLPIHPPSRATQDPTSPRTRASVANNGRPIVAPRRIVEEPKEVKKMERGGSTAEKAPTRRVVKTTPPATMSVSAGEGNRGGNADAKKPKSKSRPQSGVAVSTKRQTVDLAEGEGADSAATRRRRSKASAAAASAVTTPMTSPFVGEKGMVTKNKVSRDAVAESAEGATHRSTSSSSSSYPRRASTVSCEDGIGAAGERIKHRLDARKLAQKQQQGVKDDRPPRGVGARPDGGLGAVKTRGLDRSGIQRAASGEGVVSEEGVGARKRSRAAAGAAAASTDRVGSSVGDNKSKKGVGREDKTVASPGGGGGKGRKGVSKEAAAEEEALEKTRRKRRTGLTERPQAGRFSDS